MIPVLSPPVAVTGVYKTERIAELVSAGFLGLSQAMWHQPAVRVE